MIYPASPQQAERALGVLGELPPDAPAIGYIDVESLRKLQSSPLAALLGLGGSKSRRGPRVSAVRSRNGL